MLATSNVSGVDATVRHCDDALGSARLKCFVLRHTRLSYNYVICRAVLVKLHVVCSKRQTSPKKGLKLSSLGKKYRASYKS